MNKRGDIIRYVKFTQGIIHLFNEVDSSGKLTKQAYDIINKEYSYSANAEMVKEGDRLVRQLIERFVQLYNQRREIIREQTKQVYLTERKRHLHKGR